MAKNETFKAKIDEKGIPLRNEHGDIIVELVHSEEYADPLPEPVQQATALQAVMSATTEEIEKIKLILGIL